MELQDFETLLAQLIPDNSDRRVTPEKMRAGLTTLFAAKQPVIAPATAIATTGFAKPNDLPTNLNALTTLLGTLTGQMNATNGNVNAVAAAVKTLSDKQDALVAALKTQGLMTR